MFHVFLPSCFNGQHCMESCTTRGVHRLLWINSIPQVCPVFGVQGYNFTLYTIGPLSDCLQDWVHTPMCTQLLMG